MATASVTKAQVGKPSTEQATALSAPTRREFLYYIWGASMALILGESSAGLIWFALPRFRAGEFGGTFTLDGETLPSVDAPPTSFPAGRFWVSNVPGEGLVSLFGVCTHLGCLPKWVPTNNRFECPCHGSKYQKNGHYIEGPAPRSLDRFLTTITFEDGTTAVTDATGDPIPLPEGKKIVKIAINTGNRIKRDGRV
ncbi:MAG: Rieske 2Fe-2S domain-containing protein [Chloroflexota bacterium]